MIQSSFAVLPSLFHQKCNLLKARVIIYAYQHVRLLPPKPLVIKQPKFTRVKEPTLLCNQVLFSSIWLQLTHVAGGNAIKTQDFKFIDRQPIYRFPIHPSNLLFRSGALKPLYTVFCARWS
jgi:hypothetical protein